MNRLNFLFGFILLALSGCGMEEIQEIDKTKYQGHIAKEFKSYEIRSFIPGPINDNIVTLEGEFGGTPIEAGVTDKKEIVFVVPDLPAGTYQLKLEIGNETKIWDVRVVDQPIEVGNMEGIWDNYFLGNDIIYDSLENYPRLDFYAKEAKKWADYFKSQFSKLSDKERNELIFLIYRNGFNVFIPFSFETSGEFENCLEENFAVYAKNSFEEGWYQKQLKTKIGYLSSSKIHDAFLAFMGDLIWRQSVVEEILARKVFDCTILKNVILHTKWGPVASDPIIFNSGESLNFKLTGVYSKLGSLNRILEVEGLAYKLGYFDITKNRRSTDRDMISSLVQAKNLDLPYFYPIDFIFFPYPVQDVERPLVDYSVEIGSISNPEVNLSQKSQQEDFLIVAFENKKDETQNFQFAVTLKHSGFSITKSVKGTINEISELILDLSFDSGTANLQILSGQEPYTISWSNGVTDETQVKFSAGNYSVRVKDGNDFEEIIEFRIPEFDTVKDREGNEYQTVKIGNRWWMAENLRNTIREDGRPVKYSEGWPSWDPSFPPDFDHARYSYYQNDPENDKRYGKIYNHPAYTCCLCPEGWEMPTFEDFGELADELGGLTQIGRILKSRSNWNESIFNSTNESGFNAKPGGMKFMLNQYQHEGVFVGWWAVGGTIPNQIAFLEAGNNELKLVNRSSFYAEGHYIRCIKKK